MAELVSHLSIEPHMRTFDVFTATLSPAHAGFFCAGAISCASFAALPRTHIIHLSWSGVCPNCDSKRDPAGTVWRCPVLLSCEGAPHPPSPRGATPASRSLKSKKVRTPPARFSPLRAGGCAAPPP